jgi:hypothetical protein
VIDAVGRRESDARNIGTDPYARRGPVAPAPLKTQIPTTTPTPHLPTPEP